MLEGVSFQYKAFICSMDELEPHLNHYGDQGWRLHSCDPIALDGHLKASVVMDKVVQHGEGEDAKPEGLAMKG